MKQFFSVCLILLQVLVQSQNTKRPDNWFNLDPKTDNINGVGTDKAYQELLKDKKSTTIIVGVIDSGVDFEHEDLKSVMWTNPNEIPNNNIDDDKNGFVDDIHGWNFIGGKDGKNVNDDNLEMTRLIRKLKPKYEGKTAKDFKTEKEKSELKLYENVKKDFAITKDNYQGGYNQIKFLIESFNPLNTLLKSNLKKEKIEASDLENYSTTDKEEIKSKTLALTIMKRANANTLDDLLEELKPAFEQYKSMVEYGLNPDFDPRSIVGDDYNNSKEHNYGNNDCNGPDSFHGTHVAGIIAASRNNGIGMNGIAADVKIMAIRCVPAGDERDKDVANSIIYAVDNGAKIINMSFGKKYSWDKKVVDDAVRYAEKKGVLLIHAAGNDNLDIDEVTHYPCKKFADNGLASNFVDVGALNWQTGDKIVASFSNYGKKTVDIFAPGVDIYSTTPKNSYKDASGTSMASPVTCGVAAVLKSYYPSLSPQQIKKILIKSSNKNFKSAKVIKPGTKDELIKFDKLGKNGGVVNLYEAIKMAEKFSNSKM
jgi:subtilisin family serine protease